MSIFLASLLLFKLGVLISRVFYASLKFTALGKHIEWTKWFPSGIKALVEVAFFNALVAQTVAP